MYKRQDDEEYKTTTIRIRKEYYDKLKDIAENELEQFLDNKFKNICVYDFVNKNSDNG